VLATPVSINHPDESALIRAKSPKHSSTCPRLVFSLQQWFAVLRSKDHQRPVVDRISSSRPVAIMEYVSTSNSPSGAARYLGALRVLPTGRQLPFKHATTEFLFPQPVESRFVTISC
jgi:hypothetical protein